MRYLLLIITLLLTACNATVPSVRPYKMEITQGNIVTSKMLAQLKPGMSKSQVKFIVGTPLIQDMFHKDRWDYYLQQIIDGKITEQRRVIIDFKDDKLINVSGDVIPIEKGDIADASANVATGYKFLKDDPQVITRNPTSVVAETYDSSWTDSLMFWKDNKAEADKAALKKQIEAHNQSVLDKDAEARATAENKQLLNKSLPRDALAATPTTTISESKVDATAMGKAPEIAPAKEKKSFWSRLKFFGEAAPVVTAPIVGASSITPPLSPVPIVTITKAPELIEATQTVDDAIKPLDIKPAGQTAATAPIEATVTPIEPVAVIVETPIVNEPVIQETAAMPDQSASEELRLSEQLKTHLDLPLNNPFTSTALEPLGLQLTHTIALASQAKIDQSNIETNNKNLQSEVAAKKVPGFFERMLERVGF